MRTPERTHWNAKGTVIGLALAVLGGAGCAAGRPQVMDRPQKVEVLFDAVAASDPARRCPVAVVPQDLDSTTTCNKPACFRAPNKQRVLFEAKLARTKEKADDEFELQFDPFKSMPLRSANGTLDLVVDLDMPGKPLGTEKYFTYNVLSVPRSKCDPLDPQIIIVK